MPFNAIIICTKVNVFVRYYSFVTISKRGGGKVHDILNFGKFYKCLCMVLKKSNFLTLWTSTPTNSKSGVCIMYYFLSIVSLTSITLVTSRTLFSQSVRQTVIYHSSRNLLIIFFRHYARFKRAVVAQKWQSPIFLEKLCFT